MPAEQENILSLMLRDPASAGVFYATAEAQEKIEAELQAAQERENLLESLVRSNDQAATHNVERAKRAEAELQATREELDDANRALGESLSPEAVDDLLAEQTKALREKLAHDAR